MRYALDTEFIDTPTCSALISLGLAAEDGRTLYIEFPYPEEELTPWLRANVVPHLHGKRAYCERPASEVIREFVGPGRPEFWCYFGAYDWYHLCRVMGGMMNGPSHWPHRFRELADIAHGKPEAEGAQHNALADALGIMTAVKKALD